VLPSILTRVLTHATRAWTTDARARMTTTTTKERKKERLYTMSRDESDDDDASESDDGESDGVTLCYAGRLSRIAANDDDDDDDDALTFARRGALEVHKVGGAPLVWFHAARDDEVREVDARMGDDDVVPVCASCSMTMTLVMQTYAPRRMGEARCVYAYACARGACDGALGGRWACVRAQQRRSRGVGDDDACGGGGGGGDDDGDGDGCDEDEVRGGAARETGVVERAPAMEDTWDDPGASEWCDDGGIDALSVELDAMLATTATATTTTAATRVTTKKKLKTRREPKSQADVKAVARLNAARAAYNERCSHQFVEYFLVAEDEPAGTMSLSVRDAARADALLAKYAANEGVAVRDIVAPRSGAADASEEDWTGEGYEVGEAVHADDAYLKFHKRLQRAPEQCMRYSARGAPVIWPLKNPPKPKPCERCNKMRVCELQLTPALIRDVEDALGMYKGDRTHLASEDELLAWDWQTVCVFTCPDSCWSGADAGDDGIEYVREQIEVAESEASRDALLKALAME